MTMKAKRFLLPFLGLLLCACQQQGDNTPTPLPEPDIPTTPNTPADPPTDPGTPTDPPSTPEDPPIEPDDPPAEPDDPPSNPEDPEDPPSDPDTPTDPPSTPEDPPSEPDNPPSTPEDPEDPPTEPDTPQDPPTNPEDPDDPPSEPSTPEDPPSDPGTPDTPEDPPSDPQTPEDPPADPGTQEPEPVKALVITNETTLKATPWLLGQSRTLECEFEDGSEAIDVVLSSEQTNKVTIVGKTITAHEKGSVTITATSGQSSASVGVVFTEATSMNVTNQSELEASWDVSLSETRTIGLSFVVDETTKSLTDLGFTVDVSHTMTELDTLEADASVVYSASSNTSVVTVGGDLKLTALAAGEATIKLLYRNLVKTITLQVVEPAPMGTSTLTFDQDLLDVLWQPWLVGHETRYVVAEGEGPVLEDPDAEYAIESYDDQIVSVDIDDDTIALTPVGAGRCEVVVSYGDSLSESFEVFVSEYAVSLTDEMLKDDLSVGEDREMSVLVDGDPAASTVIESDDPEVISVVDQTIHGEQEGETYITITANEKSYLKVKITVVP